MKLVQAVLDHPEAVAIAILCFVLGTGNVPRVAEAVQRTAFYYHVEDSPCAAAPVLSPGASLINGTF